MKIVILLMMVFVSLASSASFFSRFKRSRQWQVPTESQALRSIGVASSEILDKDIIDVLIWNVHKENFQSSWIQDFNELKVGKDIILLQESTFFKETIVPDVYLDYRGALGESFTYKGVKTGNATLSKFEMFDSKVIHSPDREPLIRTPKPILITKFKLKNGKILLVLNIHGINFVRYRKFKRMINKSLKIISQHQGPIIYAGDFNTWSKKKTKYIVAEFKKQGMKWVKFRHLDRIKTHFGYPLDHAFVKGLEILDADIVKVNTSNHAPLTLRLKVL